MSKILSILTACLLTAAACSAAPCVRFHEIGTDTLRINEILAEVDPIRLDSERIPTIAKKFIDTPYVGGTLNADEECLTVNLDELDCTTFVETVLALNSAAANRRLSWRDFLGALESIRYRGGVLTDYASRLHYVTDWALDNSHRGNFREVTAQMPRGVAESVRSLDFMTTHADSYPQLADPDQLARMKSVERNFRNCRFNYVRANDVRHKEIQNALRTGDVVAMVTRNKSLDVTHMGIVDKDSDGTVRLIHASSAAGKVIVDTLSLAEYLKRNPSTIGIRVFRVSQP